MANELITIPQETIDALDNIAEHSLDFWKEVKPFSRSVQIATAMNQLRIHTILGGFRVPGTSNSKFKLQTNMKGGVRRLTCRLRKSLGHQTTSDSLHRFHCPQTGKVKLYAGHC